MKPLALIIEDESNLGLIFTKALELAGCETELIQNGNEAQERLQSIVPDVVVLDLHLPTVSGKDILAQIRHDPRLVNTSVVLATADARLAELLRDQVQLTLIKPISFEQLRNLTKRLISKKIEEIV